MTIVNAASQQIIALKGWSVIDQGNQTYLKVDNQLVKFYPFPEPTKEMAARELILENSSLELEATLNTAFQSNEGALPTAIQTLYDDLGKATDKQARNAIMQDLACKHLNLGIVKARESLEAAQNHDLQKAETLRTEAALHFSDGVNAAYAGEMPIAGRAVKANMNTAYSPMVRGLNDIMDLQTPVSDTIAEWYSKTAKTINGINELCFNLSSVENAGGYIDQTTFKQACNKLKNAAIVLLQTRRDDVPDYDNALAAVGAEVKAVKGLVDAIPMPSDPFDQPVIVDKKATMNKMVDSISAAAVSRGMVMPPGRYTSSSSSLVIV